MSEHQQTQQSKKPESTFQKQSTPLNQIPVSHPASIIQRARINPKSLTAADVLQLQRTIGNRAVGRLLSEIRNTSKVQQAPIQRQKLEHEEICPSCMQKQKIPEEEPLQGKMVEPVQRQEIPEEEELIQGKMIGTVQRQEIPNEDETLQKKSENNTGMPDNLKAGVESVSGIDMSDVKVHYNSDKPAEVGALAYTQGTNIHVAPGQEKHLPHEAWHVVQQAQGRVRPTLQMKNRIPVNDDEGLEHEADVMGARSVQTKEGLNDSRFDLDSQVKEEETTAAAVAQGVSSLLDRDERCMPSTSVAVMQRVPTKWEDLEEDKRGTIWGPHRTKIDSQSGESLGSGASIKGLADMAAPQIAYSGKGMSNTNLKIDSGGKGVTAKMLGPNHPIGKEAPKWETPENLSQVTKIRYKGVQLLPKDLGGSDDTENLVALPESSVDELLRFHNRALRLVHSQRTFINYYVNVEENKYQHQSCVGSSAEDVPYVEFIKMEWEQVDHSGSAISASKGSSTLEIPSPSDLLNKGSKSKYIVLPLLNGLQNQAIHPDASLNKHAEARADFTTHITFGAANSTGDGTEMEAHRLGPDHKVGSEPEKGSNTWNQRTKALHQASGGKKYIAGHLLNHHLGGPGDDERNLAPIPEDANKLHEKEVESVIKDLVNTQFAWVYYKVHVNYGTEATTATTATTAKKAKKAKKATTVTTATTATIDYPKEFECIWHQLDMRGNVVVGTEGKKTIKIPPPSEYIKASKGATVNKQTSPIHEEKTDDTATTLLAYDEVLLEDNDTLKRQLLVMKPLVASLKQLGLEPTFKQNGALASDLKLVIATLCPSVVEAKLHDDLEILTKKLADVSQIQEILDTEGEIKKVEPLLDNIMVEALKRHKATSKELRDFTRKHFNVDKTDNIAEAIESTVRNDAFNLGRLIEDVRNIVHFAEVGLNQLKDHRSRILSMNTVMTTWTGLPPARPIDSAQELSDDFMSKLTSGMAHVIDSVDEPRTPTQTVSVAKVETQKPISDSMEGMRELTKTRADLSKTQPKSTVPASHEGADKLLKLIENFADKWPKWTPNNTSVDPLAMTIETLVASLPSTMSGLKETVKSFYKTKTVALNEYLSWVTENLQP